MVEDVCSQHISLTEALFSILIIILCVVKCNQLSGVVADLGCDWWNDIVNRHVAEVCSLDIVHCVVVSVSVVDSVQNLCDDVSFLIVDEGDLEVMESIGGYQDIFHLEDRIVFDAGM